MFNVDEVAHLVSFLPIDEMIKCRRVSHHWKIAVHSDQLFWNKMFNNYYQIDQYYQDDHSSCSCWLDKLLKVCMKIPKKQINSKNQLFNPQSLEIVKNYKSFFCKKDLISHDYCGTHKKFCENENDSYKFCKEISTIDVKEVLDHLLIVIIYDAMTISGYTPNLLIDQIKAQVVMSSETTLEKKIPLLTFLSCFLKADNLRDNCHKLADFYFYRPECIDFTVGLNIEQYVPMIDIGQLISSSFIDDAELKDPFDVFQLAISEGELILSYFNAGGGWSDSIDLQLCVNSSDRTLVDVERMCIREFY